MRPPLEERLLRLAEYWATWSTCHIKHGAVLAYGNEVLATGFNGAPKGEPHCTDVGCEMHRGHCKRTIHAEINAIERAVERRLLAVPGSLNGASAVWADDATLYVTGSPCRDCQQRIAEIGIGRVVFRGVYSGVRPDRAGVEWIEWGYGGPSR